MRLTVSLLLYHSIVGTGGKESGPLIEMVSSIQSHYIPKTSSRMAKAVLLRELSLFLECPGRVEISYTECMECSNIVCACVIINY